MEKIVIVFLALFFILPIFTNSFHSTYYESLPYEPVKLTKTNLRFYLHDTLSGDKPTSVQVAGPKTTGTDPGAFGNVYSIDDPLTEGPEITSKLIGNARGLYVSASQDKKLTLVLYVDLGFTDGVFKGSSLSVFSRNPVTENPREMAVVGGRGMFRMAQGTVFVKTQFLNFTTGDAVLEYNVEVVHPSEIRN